MIQTTISGGNIQGIVGSIINELTLNVYCNGELVPTERKLTEEGRKLVEQALRLQPPGSHRPETRTAKFVGRDEWFGSLVYDREHDDYIPFDEDSTKIFRLAQSRTEKQIYAQFESVLQPQSFETFVQLCKSIGLLDNWGKFGGVFIEGEPAPRGVLSAPTRVYLACTRACNFRCRHCFSSSGNPYANELTTNEITDLIDDLADLGCFKLSLGGGEPLVRRDLPAIIGRANARGVAVEISTNGVAATPAVVKTLKDLRIHRFKVSMDGASEEIYDAIRGEPGAFQAARQGIENLKELQAPISLRHVLMKPNAGHLPELIALAEELQVDQISIANIMPAGRAAENPDLLLDWQESNRLWDEAIAIRNSTKVDVVIPLHVPFRAGKRLYNGFGCDCGRLQCHVDARGEVTPSGLLNGTLSAGNIRQGSFKEIWLSGNGFTQLRNLPGNGRCTACQHYAGCRGGCRASAALMDHDINLPDGNCALTHSGLQENAN
jgi:radical SAM protein with 4Fe4S-binding SPASM domain